MILSKNLNVVGSLRSFLGLKYYQIVFPNLTMIIRLHMSYKPIWICTIRDEELTNHRKIYLEDAKTENSYNKLFPNQVSNRLDVSWSSRKSCLWLINKLEKVNQSNVIGLCKFIETTIKPWPATINVPPEKYDVNSMKVKTTN